MKRDQRWIDNLCEEYPSFKEYPEVFKSCFDFSVGPGWTELVEELTAKLVSMAKEAHLDFRVLQVKEKFGMLRYYPAQATEEMRELIYKYEGRSGKICEMCGKPGEVREEYQDGTPRGWLKTLCDEHNVKPSK